MKNIILFLLQVFLLVVISGCVWLPTKDAQIVDKPAETEGVITLKDVPNHPICIDINIKTAFDKVSRSGKCYYEQYDPVNIFVKASEKANSKYIELFLINGKYVLQKGDIPAGSEFKYLIGYMANLQLIQKLISDGMKKATPIGSGKRSFSFSDDVNPFIIRILNKKVVYPAPWSVSGIVKPRSDEKGFDFDINFNVQWGKQPNVKVQNSDFSGSFSQEEKILGDDILFSEWQQYGLNSKGVLSVLTSEKEFFHEFWN